MATSPRPSFALRAAASLAALVTLIAIASPARAQIKSPGAHPDYSVELEPHFLLQWSHTHWYDDGLGLGLRASIPVIDNGPVTTINNNFAIGFGLDWAHYGDNCGADFRWRRGGVIVVPANGFADCSAEHFIVPINVQWNFFFTKVVSLHSELGLAIQHSSESYCNGNCGEDSWTEVIPVFSVGPRFLLADSFAILLRVGVPYLSVGGSFLL